MGERIRTSMWPTCRSCAKTMMALTLTEPQQQALRSDACVSRLSCLTVEQAWA